MAGLRGYPQPGYKAAARDFQSAPPLSPKKAAPGSGGDPVDAQLLQEMISGNPYSRKEQLLLETILEAAGDLVDGRNTVAKAVRVPGRMLPVLNAFLLGFDLTNLAIDWYATLVTPTKDSNGWWVKPNLTGYSEYCRIGNGNVWKNTESACGSIAFGLGASEPGATDWRGFQGAVNGVTAVNESIREDFTWLSPGYNRDYRVALLYPNTSGPVPDLGDPYFGGLAAPMETGPEEPKIPFKLIPYVNPDLTPVDPKPQVDSGWYFTNGPTPPDMTYKDYPGKERKAQTTSRGWKMLRAAGKLFGAATESCDFVEAMWDAIPEKTRVNLGYQYVKTTYKRRPGPVVQRMSAPTRTFKVSTGDGFYITEKRAVEPKLVNKKPPLVKDALGRPLVESTRLSRISCTRMAKAFAQNPRLVDQLDLNKALNNFIVNQIEDAAIGLPNKIANNAFVNTPGYDRPFGLGLGPAL